MAGQFKTRVGNNIRRYRAAANMTMKELADKVGLSESTISKYESGDIKSVDVELLARIANAISCKPENLTEWGSEQERIEHKEEMYGKRQAKFLKKFDQLSFSNQKEAMKYIDYLLYKQSKS